MSKLLLRIQTNAPLGEVMQIFGGLVANGGGFTGVNEWTFVRIPAKKRDEAWIRKAKLLENDYIVSDSFVPAAPVYR